MKNGIELRKLLPPKVKRSRTQKQTIKPYKGWFLNTQKIPCMLLLLLESKDDLQKFRLCFYGNLNRLK
jgi:hypothetical protein